MQVLKEEVRLNIRQAAIKVFKDQGYKKASMRDIAAEAGMSVGNLYRYYKNKEAMFKALVDPVIKRFEERPVKIEKMDMSFMEVDLTSNDGLIDRFVEVHQGMRDELFLLVLRSEGSPYERVKEGMADFFEEQLQRFLEQEIPMEQRQMKSDLMVKAMAIGFMEAFCCILEEAETDEVFARNILEHHEFMVKPILKNILDLRDNKVSYRRISDEEIRDYIGSHRGNCGHRSTQSA